MSGMNIYAFGGSEDEVRNYQKEFIKYFVQCKTVLDIGSGRGIFLELLRQQGIAGTGIERCGEVVVSCRKKGFTVIESDLFEYLENTTDKYDGIFCAHIIEHFEYEKAELLIKLANKVLNTDGTMVIVTPNPRSLRVTGNIFWLDSTHKRMYPGELIANMSTSAGFAVEQIGSMEKTSGIVALMRRLIESIIVFRPVGVNVYVVARKKRGGRIQ